MRKTDCIVKGFLLVDKKKIIQSNGIDTDPADFGLKFKLDTATVWTRWLVS